MFLTISSEGKKKQMVLLKEIWLKMKEKIKRTDVLRIFTTSSGLIGISMFIEDNICLNFARTTKRRNNHTKVMSNLCSVDSLVLYLNNKS